MKTADEMREFNRQEQERKEQEVEQWAQDPLSKKTILNLEKIIENQAKLNKHEITVNISDGSSLDWEKLKIYLGLRGYETDLLDSGSLLISWR